MFGYRDKATGAMTWYCAPHRLGQYWADARRGEPVAASSLAWDGWEGRGARRNKWCDAGRNKKIRKVRWQLANGRSGMTTERVKMRSYNLTTDILNMVSEHVLRQAGERLSEFEKALVTKQIKGVRPQVDAKIRFLLSSVGRLTDEEFKAGLGKISTGKPKVTDGE
jgi:hypothetical protein